MIIGIPKELFPGERRVSLIPETVHQLTKKGFKVIVETNAGYDAGFTDNAYLAKGAKIISSRKEVFQKAKVILQIRAWGSDEDSGKKDLSLLHDEQIVIGFTDPLGNAEKAREFERRNVTTFSMEMIPRITRAQSMDALSSIASIAGYKAVLTGANLLQKMFPMMMTAAGTIAPAKVFVIGAGVAGLNAIATAKRLGAIVSAYDVRPDVKEQIESLGGKFIEIELDTSDSQDEGGYAKEQTDDFLAKQREMMFRVVSESDVVITTAAIPGKRSPVLVTKEMVEQMHPGTVIVDLASERGGNCELTKHGETISEFGVVITGPANISSDLAYHASQMYSKNISTLLLHLATENSFNFDMNDEITAGSMITHKNQILHPRVRDLLGLEPVTPVTVDNNNREE